LESIFTITFSSYNSSPFPLLFPVLGNLMRNLSFGFLSFTLVVLALPDSPKENPPLPVNLFLFLFSNASFSGSAFEELLFRWVPIRLSLTEVKPPHHVPPFDPGESCEMTNFIPYTVSPAVDRRFTMVTPPCSPIKSGSSLFRLTDRCFPVH